MRSFSMKRLTVIAIILMIAACGGGGGGGGTTAGGTGSPNIPTTGGNEGSAGAPIQLTVNTTRNNSIVGLIDDSYYTFTTAGPGSYSISLTNTSTALGWDLYTDAAFTTHITSSGSTCHNWMTSAADVKCVVALSASTPYYVKVSSLSLSGGTFSITPAEIVSEGTTTAPIELIVGQTHAGSIDANGKSYYKFKTTKTGPFTASFANWQIAGAGTISIGTKIFNADFAPANQLVSCGAGQFLINYCTANALDADTYYYVEMSQNAAHDVQLNVSVSEGVSQGSAANPVPLTLGTVQNGAVDGYGDSYYSFTTTAAGSYLFTKTGDLVEVYIYSDSSYSAQVASYGYSFTVNGKVYTISGLEPGKQYFMKVHGSYSTDAVYTILVQSGVTEGSVNAPLQLNAGVAHNASIDANGTAYYYFTPTMSGTVEINLSSTLDAEWVLTSDSQFTQALYVLGTYTSSCRTTDLSNGNCTTSHLDFPANYYLKVTNKSTSTGSYAITYTEGTGSEGSLNNPVTLTMGVPYTGRAAAGVSNSISVTSVGSYYKFRPATSDQLLIMVKNFASGGSGDVTWDLYPAAVAPNPQYSSSLIIGCYAWASGSIYSNDMVCTTANYQPAITITANNDYYLKVSNNKAVKNTYTILIVPYSSLLGCNAGGTCLNFDTMPTTIVTDPSFSFTNPSTDWNGNILDYNGRQVLAWLSGTNTPGGGGSSIQSEKRLPTGSDKFPSWTSCFQFTATNMKWLSFSVNTQASSTFDSLVFYVDNNAPSYQSRWEGNTPWRRVLFSETTAGLHTYKWCYSKGNTADNASVAWIDDIELHY